MREISGNLAQPRRNNVILLNLDLDAKLKEDLSGFQAQQEEIVGPQAKQRESAEATFEKAKLLYYQGKYEEAINLWSKLTPYLDPDSEERILIESLRRNYLKLQTAKTQSASLDTSAQGTFRWTPPQDLQKLLMDANQKLVTQIK